jgi:hypothetical protein
VPLAARRRAHELFTANLAPLGVRLINEPRPRPTRDTPPASPSISALTYSGAQTPRSSLAGRRVYLAERDRLPTQVSPDMDMETTLRHTREMTKSAEHEMHAIVMACTPRPEANARGDANETTNRALALGAANSTQCVLGRDVSLGGSRRALAGASFRLR